MSTFMIGYDLGHKGEASYDELDVAIRALGPAWHHLDSTWLVTMSLTTTAVRDRLTPHLKNGDKLVVISLGSSWACTAGFSQEAKDWLRTKVSRTA